MAKSDPPDEPADTAEQASAPLADVEQTMRARFPDAADRLAQLSFHLATAAMAIEHLYDEEPRHREHAERQAARAALGL